MPIDYSNYEKVLKSCHGFWHFFIIYRSTGVCYIGITKTFWKKEGDTIRKVNSLIRLLCGLIDVIIIMLPVQFIMMGIFQVSTRQADLLFKLLFAVYGVLFMEYMQGRTIGKYFGKIKVRDKAGDKPSMLYTGLRELAKSLYFIPYIGWALGAVSVFMIVFGNGRAIHDYIGNTMVSYLWSENTMQSDEPVSQ